MCLNKNECWKFAHRVGLFFAVLFVLCFAWYYIHPVEQELMLRLLKGTFFGYSGMDATSFFLGLIQSYLHGLILVGLWELTGFGAKKGSACCGKNEMPKM